MQMIEMLQDTIDGNPCNNSWKGPVWQVVLDSLANNLKSCSACESKFVCLKTDHKEVRHLQEMSSFS